MTRLGRIGVSFAVVIVAGTAVRTALPEPKDSRPVCEQADEWVRFHRPIATVGYIAALPQRHRSAAFSTLTPAGRAKVFREHILAFASENPEMNDRQRAVVTRMLNLATEDTYSHPKEPRIAMELAALKTEERSLFGDKAARLGTLSDVGAAPRSSLQLWRLRLVTALRSSFVV